MKNAAGNGSTEVSFVDCGPREGLVTVAKDTSSLENALLINRLAETGVSKIDCVAFAHPRLLPRHSNAEDVMRQVDKKPGVSYIGLVPSEVGCRRAVLTEIDEILATVATTEELNRVVLGLSTKDTLNRTLPVIFSTAAQGRKTVRGYILAAFGCPYSGKFPPRRLYEIISRLAFMGAREVSLVDSTGMANPRQVKEITSEILRMHPEIRLAVHFHNTRGTGLLNCLAAYEVGVRVFDSAVGGLSGTPFGYPDLEIGSWNVPTEDLVHLLEELGVDTGIDLDRLLECVEMAEKMAGRMLPGHILRAGSSSSLLRAPMPASLR